MTVITLTDGDGFPWDISDEYENQWIVIDDGDADHFDGGFRLSINGTVFESTLNPLGLGSRTVTAEQDIGSLTVNRSIYVPEDAGLGFARFLDSVTNNSATAVTVEFMIQTNSGNDSSLLIAATSSGDAVYDTSDFWVVNTDSSDPADTDAEAVLHLLGDGSVAPTSVSTTVFDSSGDEGIAYTYSVTIGAGQTLSLLSFGSQQDNSGDAQAELSTLLDPAGRLGLSDAALEGLSDADISQVFNFDGTAQPPVNPGSPPPPTNINGTEGSDVIVGNREPNLITAFEGDDTATGGASDDTIFGNQGNDRLLGQSGSDTVYGGMDNDTIYGGDEAASFFDEADVLYGNRGNDIIFGNLGDDQLFGNEDNDQLFGGQGNDSLYGGQGNDTMNGGLGDDLLQGGFGADTYVFASNQGNDVITDFRFGEGDRLDLQGQSYVLGQNNEGQATLFLEDGGTVVLLGYEPADFQAGFVA